MSSSHICKDSTVWMSWKCCPNNIRSESSSATKSAVDCSKYIVEWNDDENEAGEHDGIQNSIENNIACAKLSISPIISPEDFSLLDSISDFQARKFILKNWVELRNQNSRVGMRINIEYVFET